MAFNREEDRTEEEEGFLRYLKKLYGDRGGDINDFDQEYVEPTANENYGYVNKPGLMKVAGFLPGPMGTAAKVTSGMINQGNNQAVRRAREAMGLPNQKPSFVKDVMEGPKNGKIADVNIAGQNYPVGFEAQDADEKTTLTPNEARQRSLVTGQGLKEVKSQQVAKSGGLFGNIFGGQQPVDNDPGETLASGLGLPDAHNYRTAPQKDMINDPDLPARDMANVNYDLEGKGRSEIPSSGIGNKVADVVTDMLGSGYSVDVTSGQEPAGRSPVGSQYRHPLGFAADLKITDPQGRTLSLANPADKTAIQDVAHGMAARYGANFGMGPEYMGDETMHIDTMDLNKYRGGPQWASVGKEWAGVLDNARATGVMPSQYYDIDNPPVPGQRPEEPSNLIAEQDEPQETPAEQAVGFMGRTQPQEKQKESLPTYDSLMSGTTGPTVNPDRFKDITDEERSLMGMTLAGEIDPSKTDLSTPDGRKEAMGILSTMENRKDKFGSIKDAIQAPNQYSTWNNDAAANTASKNYYGNQSQYDSLVSDYISDPSNNLGFTSYHANTVNPGWSSAMDNKTTIGPHTFGFLKEYAPSKAPSVTPTTVFNTTAMSAPKTAGGLGGMVSAENSMRSSMTSSNQPATTSSAQETRGFSGGSGGGSTENRSGSGFGGSSSMSSGGATTDTSSGKDKDDKSGFGGSRSY